MPKLKSHSGAKKRFKFTGTGKVKATQAYKRHRMRNRSQQTIRDRRGCDIIAKSEWSVVRRLLPYG